ncbi:MAG: glycosyltransferase [bacterium]
MKILIINNFFEPIGGAEKYVNSLGNILQTEGHEVFYYACKADEYFEKDYKYSNYFPDRKGKSLKKIYKRYYNKNAEINLEAYLQEIKPDIVHINNIGHNLTVSVVNACEKYNIPMVMTIHDCGMFCPGGRLMRHNKTFCKGLTCLGKSDWIGLFNCITNKCYRNSLYESVKFASVFFYNKNSKLYKYPSFYICPSNAIKNLAIKSGLAENKLTTINNFLEDSQLEIIPNYNDNGYFLYCGRLSDEKGLKSLIAAMKLLPKDIELRLVGSGGEESKLKKLAKDMPNIKFLGYMSGTELEEEYKNCIATIIPSNGFDNFPTSAMESFFYGKAVIGSNIGGIPEIVENNETGLIFEPADAEKLAEAINILYKDRTLSVEMGKKARNKAENLYTKKAYYEKLKEVYEKVLNF